MAMPQKKSSGLRMNELTAATGVPKSTILFYLSERLLPPPVKTSPNMAYYDPACVNRIRLIQHLKNRHRLSLAEIRTFFESQERGPDFSIYLELNEIIFGSNASERLVDAEDFCRETELTPAELDELIRARLLLPLEKNRFDPQDIAMGQVYARGLKFGIRIADLKYYVKFGEKIVDHEMALRNRQTGRLTYPEDAATTIQMVKNARTCRAYVIDRLFQHRVAAMRDLKERGKRP
jgi:DNA-binding transcriptional MerR regulator